MRDYQYNYRNKRENKTKMTENIVEVKNLTKIYDEGDVLAVDDISLTLKKGEIFALLGPNGAGKTTTISMLATLLKPTKGTATVNSYNIDEDPDKVRKSIGVVFQEPSLDGDMKAEENLELHAILYGMSKSERREKIKEVLKLVNLDDKAEMYTKNYSGGMKRRLEIARGLIHNPQMLFLDEPTLGLDPQTRRKIWEKIKQLNEELKMTILITTHYMEEADVLADRICIMDHGKIIALDTSENLKHQLSGDIIEIELENVHNLSMIPQLISQLKEIKGIKDVKIGAKGDQGVADMTMNLPAGMKNMNPQMMQMIQQQMKEIMTDAKKFVRATKKFPMASNFFSRAPLEAKERVANLFKGNKDLLEELPKNMKETILKIQSGEYEEKQKNENPLLTISCENGAKQITEIIQKISNSDNLNIKSVQMHNPTLEDVFLFYTGREIREESSNNTEDVKKLIQMRQLRQNK
ncbi:MAG: Daunorubicin resistance ABC transporter ATPase subunit (modular protein) [Promethearchaeota archaeon]|nr:MAG: Daunorubicin resistance ABC transporter ATPase subunit (modular protein) [Candidatus Lokiarchaeota archaeon]